MTTEEVNEMQKHLMAEITEDPNRIKLFIQKTHERLSDSDSNVTVLDIIVSMLQNGIIDQFQFTKIYLHA